MEALLITLTILLVAGGVIFSILPPLPGTLLSYAGMFCIHSVSIDTQFTTTSFVLWGILGVIIIVADYAIPVAATKRFGGTKAGVIGGMIGMVAGVLLPIPFGIILGSLLGAIIGDLYGGNRIKSAFKSGLGSLIGFLIATTLKLLYSIILGGVIALKIGGFTWKSIMETV